jgi:hypothetical protein
MGNMESMAQVDVHDVEDNVNYIYRFNNKDILVEQICMLI